MYGRAQLDVWYHRGYLLATRGCKGCGVDGDDVGGGWICGRAGHDEVCWAGVCGTAFWCGGDYPVCEPVDGELGEWMGISMGDVNGLIMG